jgi:hypothetical protein
MSNPYFPSDSSLGDGHQRPKMGGYSQKRFKRCFLKKAQPAKALAEELMQQQRNSIGSIALPVFHLI